MKLALHLGCDRSHEEKAHRQEREAMIPVADGPSSLPIGRMASHVDHHGAGKEKDGVFALHDINAIAVSECEPPLGDCSNRSRSPAKHILVICKVALSSKVVGAGDVDGEGAPEKREQFLLG